ncbi:Zinc metalloprotease [Bifidobacterium cebidarum]|uniref:Zinc metalloprotease n=1 Tax=Bifidobacterium cebidarum TaxID=2650773 RepID=A0A6I1GH40_9BIFI|nr:Zinc metalloprotease [Bifidobacterium cebidarum]
MVRKPIKNMYLRIKPPSGDVVVSAPNRMSERTIVDFVRGRRAWIDGNVRKMQRARERSLVAEPEHTGFVWTDELRQQAAANINAQLPALLAHWGAVVGRTPTHITLRLMTTRWGSCTPKTGRIRLNLQLGLMEPRFLEYVLVHEMTHLWERGHGAGFQRRIGSYLPNWRELRRDLNRRVVL